MRGQRRSLAAIADQTENAALIAFFQAAEEAGVNTYNVWLGLRTEDGATWTDPAETQHYDGGWASGEPNETSNFPACVSAGRDNTWQWTDSPCTNAARVLCEL